MDFPVAPTFKPLIAALNRQGFERPPFWLMRQAGRYLPEYREVRRQAGDFISLCLTPNLACEVTLQPLRRYGMDAAILFSDILMVPYGLGQKLEYREGEGPCLESVANEKELSRLSDKNFHDILSPVYQTVDLIKRQLPDNTTLIGFAGSPWTVACYMVQGSGSKEWDLVKRFAFCDPTGFDALIHLLVTVTSEYLSAQVVAGAEVLQLFDSWAGVLSASAFRRLVIEPTKTLVTLLKAKHPTIPIIGFPRGAGVLIEEYVTQTGVDAVALDTTVPPIWAARTLQPLVPVQGNLDPFLLVAGGDIMRSGVDEILETLNGGPFIFNLGHGVSQVTPPEHVAQLASLIRTWPERRQ